MTLLKIISCTWYGINYKVWTSKGCFIGSGGSFTLIQGGTSYICGVWTDLTNSLQNPILWNSLACVCLVFVCLGIVAKRSMKDTGSGLDVFLLTTIACWETTLAFFSLLCPGEWFYQWLHLVWFCAFVNTQLNRFFRSSNHRWLKTRRHFQ